MELNEVNDRKLIKTYQLMMLILFVLILVVAIVLSVFTGADDIVKVTDDNILLFTPEGQDQVFIEITSIQSISFYDELDITKRDDETIAHGYTYGWGIADGVGEVKYYDYDRADKFIVVSDGEELIAFNYYNNQNTEDFYEALTELVEELQNG